MNKSISKTLFTAAAIILLTRQEPHCLCGQRTLGQNLVLFLNQQDPNEYIKQILDVLIDKYNAVAENDSIYPKIQSQIRQIVHERDLPLEKSFREDKRFIKIPKKFSDYKFTYKLVSSKAENLKESTFYIFYGGSKSIIRENKTPIYSHFRILFTKDPNENKQPSIDPSFSHKINFVDPNIKNTSEKPKSWTLNKMKMSNPNKNYHNRFNPPEIPSQRDYLSYFQINEFELKICINFYIFMNKLLRDFDQNRMLEFETKTGVTTSPFGSLLYDKKNGKCKSYAVSFKQFVHGNPKIVDKKLINGIHKLIKSENQDKKRERIATIFNEASKIKTKIVKRFKKKAKPCSQAKEIPSDTNFLLKTQLGKKANKFSNSNLNKFINLFPNNLKSDSIKKNPNKNGQKNQEKSDKNLKITEKKNYHHKESNSINVKSKLTATDNILDHLLYKNEESLQNNVNLPTLNNFLENGLITNPKYNPMNVQKGQHFSKDILNVEYSSGDRNQNLEIIKNRTKNLDKIHQMIENQRSGKSNRNNMKHIEKFSNGKSQKSNKLHVNQIPSLRNKESSKIETEENSDDIFAKYINQEYRKIHNNDRETHENDEKLQVLKIDESPIDYYFGNTVNSEIFSDKNCQNDKFFELQYLLFGDDDISNENESFYSKNLFEESMTNPPQNVKSSDFKKGKGLYIESEDSNPGNEIINDNKIFVNFPSNSDLIKENEKIPENIPNFNEVFLNEIHRNDSDNLITGALVNNIEDDIQQMNEDGFIRDEKSSNQSKFIKVFSNKDPKNCKEFQFPVELSISFDSKNSQNFFALKRKSRYASVVLSKLIENFQMTIDLGIEFELEIYEDYSISITPKDLESLIIDECLKNKPYNVLEVDTMIELSEESQNLNIKFDIMTTTSKENFVNVSFKGLENLSAISPEEIKKAYLEALNSFLEYFPREECVYVNGEVSDRQFKEIENAWMPNELI
jgi:hypothetical protein